MRGLGFLCLLALGGCKAEEYLCVVDQECVASNGGHGRCVAAHCAYVDPSCPGSQLRFDETGGDLAKMCVDPALLGDGGVSDAAPTDAGPTDADDDAAPVDADTSG
jgi:hypothetical protein